MGKRKNSGLFKGVVILVLLVGGGVAVKWLLKEKGTTKPEFSVVKAARTNIIQTVTATGALQPVVNVEVGSQISGIIQTLYVDFNSEVKSNQVIAQLDPSTYQANVSSAEGDLANTEASLELAQVNAKRARDLFQDKLISSSDFDQSVATLHQAEAQVKIKRAALERAKVDLGRCTIYAPVDGIVIDRKVDVGQTVAASLSAPVLFQIANDLTKMQINASVAEADVGAVQSGQDVEFSVDAFPYRKFRGTVTQVRNSPITVQNVVTYDTIIAVNNDDLKLKPGMTANVDIIVAQRKQVLAVPNAALRFRPPENLALNASGNAGNAAVQRSTAGRSGGRTGGAEGRGGGAATDPRANSAHDEATRPPRTMYTLTVSPDKATEADLKQVSVRLGISDGFWTEVTEGLSDGELLVSSMTTGTTSANPVNNPFSGRGFPRR